MTNRRKYIIFAVSWGIFLFATAVFPQTTLPAPKQEKLLNGLKVLMWSDPKADKVSVKIRIHSGSAFDPQGKEGLMQMLADNLFPNEAARDFFKEDLGGDLEITANYDYLQVNASASPESFLAMLESVATAVSNPTIDKETTTKLRTALLAKVATFEADPAYVADQAVAKRLFGTFPYGRPQFGTAESLKKIEVGDLIDAKNRFLTADNATIAISGNFDKAIGFRAIKRYLGGWLKADKKIPTTFRQPDEPPSALLVVPSPKAGSTETRFAIRGPARSDKDIIAAMAFSIILRNRMLLLTKQQDIELSFDAFALPGIITIKLKQNDDISTSTRYFSKSLSDLITQAEFAPMKNAVLWVWPRRDRIWVSLDSDTYNIPLENAEMRSVDTLTLAEVIAYAEKVRKLPIVSVLVNGSALDSGKPEKAVP